MSGEVPALCFIDPLDELLGDFIVVDLDWNRGDDYGGFLANSTIDPIWAVALSMTSVFANIAAWIVDALVL
jgi:hypothetical protein